MAATFAPGDASTMGGLGFDATASPPWLMVPNDAVRAKRVLLTGGAGLSLKLSSSSKTGIITFQELAGTTAGRPIMITGVFPGTVRLEAQDSTGAAQATLEITVKGLKTLATCFWFVFDKSHRSSIKGYAEVMQMIEVANKLFLPQVNVMMVRKDSGGFYLPFDLDKGVPIPIAFNIPAGWLQTPSFWETCVSQTTPGADGCMPPTSQGTLSAADYEGIRINNILCNILDRGDRKADYNIFLVRKLDDPVTIAPTGAYTLINSKGVCLNACILPDISGGQNLAHEVGHFLLTGATFLSRTGHTTGKNDLMKEVPGQWDVQIPKQSANVMNPSGFP